MRQKKMQFDDSMCIFDGISSSEFKKALKKIVSQEWLLLIGNGESFSLQLSLDSKEEERSVTKTINDTFSQSILKKWTWTIDVFVYLNLGKEEESLELIELKQGLGLDVALEILSSLGFYCKRSDLDKIVKSKLV